MGRVIERFLVDKSAFARMYVPAVGSVLEPLILAGQVAYSGIAALEILYSAQSFRDFVATRRELEQSLTPIDTGRQDLARALDVMQALAERGQHRGTSIPDLLIAASAERAGLTVLHYDEDYDRIASVTHQPMRWVAPRGSI